MSATLDSIEADARANSREWTRALADWHAKVDGPHDSAKAAQDAQDRADEALAMVGARLPREVRATWEHDVMRGGS
jgi:hypothetical protein